MMIWLFGAHELLKPQIPFLEEIVFGNERHILVGVRRKRTSSTILGRNRICQYLGAQFVHICRTNRAS